MKSFRRILKRTWVSIRHSKNATIGFYFLVIIVAIAILAPLLAPYDPLEMNVGTKLLAPSSEYIMGTDMYGRDVLSRVLAGTSVSLSVGLLVVVLSMLIGVPLGLFAGFIGGWVDNIIMRFTDLLLCFPWVLVALCIAAITGPGMPVVILALVIAYVPTFIRLMQGMVLSVREKEYVEAAVVTGEKRQAIIWRYIFPNCIAPLIVEATLIMSFVILSEAAISYLGVGIQPPTPSWGTMLSESMTYLWPAPYLAIFPGIAIIATVLAVNIFGDGLRDILDPRYMGGLRDE